MKALRTLSPHGPILLPVPSSGELPDKDFTDLNLRGFGSSKEKDISVQLKHDPSPMIVVKNADVTAFNESLRVQLLTLARLKSNRDNLNFLTGLGVT
jgi:hypothetical protein